MRNLATRGVFRCEHHCSMSTFLSLGDLSCRPAIHLSTLSLAPPHLFLSHPSLSQSTRCAPKLRVQPPQKLRREVTNHNPRPRPQYSLRTLKRHRLQIKHASLRARMDHRILPTHLVRRDR